MRVLPDLARDEVPLDGERQAFTVLVTDEAGKPIYTATLSSAGIWLKLPTPGASKTGVGARS